MSLDLRTESVTFSCRPGPEDRKEASRWGGPKKGLVTECISTVLFDVGFLPSFSKHILNTQTFQNHTAGVRRISN